MEGLLRFEYSTGEGEEGTGMIEAEGAHDTVCSGQGEVLHWLGEIRSLF